MELMRYPLSCLCEERSPQPCVTVMTWQSCSFEDYKVVTGFQSRLKVGTDAPVCPVVGAGWQPPTSGTERYPDLYCRCVEFIPRRWTSVHLTGKQ